MSPSSPGFPLSSRLWWGPGGLSNLHLHSSGLATEVQVRTGSTRKYSQEVVRFPTQGATVAGGPVGPSIPQVLPWPGGGGGLGGDGH